MTDTKNKMTEGHAFQDSDELSIAGATPFSDNPEWLVGGLKFLLGGIASEIPYVGSIAGGAIDFALELLWQDDGTSMWNKLRPRIEDLINEKIAEEHMANIQKRLDGIYDVVTYYKDIVLGGDDYSHIRETWGDAYTAVIEARRTFQDERYALALTPLFVQLANLEIMLHRDMIGHGCKWGFTQSTVNTHQRYLSTIVDDTTSNTETSYVAWVLHQYREGRKNVKHYEPRYDQNGQDLYPMQHTKALLDYDREFHLHSLDYAKYIWPYLDVVKHPGAVTVPAHREVFFGPYGNEERDPNGFYSRFLDEDASSKEASEKLEALEAWSGPRFNAINQKIAGKWTGRIGSSGGDYQGSGWGTDSFPATAFGVKSGTGVNGFRFKTAQGAFTGWMGRNQGGRPPYSDIDDVSLPGHMIRKVHCWNADRGDNNLASLIVGLRPESDEWTWQSDIDEEPPVSMLTVGSTYVFLNTLTSNAIDLDVLSSADGVPLAHKAYDPNASSQRWTVTHRVGPAGTPLQTFVLKNGFSGKYIYQFASNEPNSLAPVQHFYDLINWPPKDIEVVAKVGSGGKLHLFFKLFDTFYYFGASESSTRLTADAFTSTERGYDWTPILVRTQRSRGIDGRRPLMGFAVEPGQHDVGYFRADITITNPPAARDLSGWQLSFDLPVEAGDRIEFAGGDEVGIRTHRTPSALRVHVTPAGQTPRRLVADSTVSFAVSGGASNHGTSLREAVIKPSRARINGLPLQNI